LCFNREALKISAPENDAGIGVSWAKPHIDPHTGVKTDSGYSSRSS
jgi:hypothetical protein